MIGAVEIWIGVGFGVVGLRRMGGMVEFMVGGEGLGSVRQILFCLCSAGSHLEVTCCLWCCLRIHPGCMWWV